MWLFIALVLISFFVRIFSVSAGGGGLILIPTLVMMGLPPSVAIATNRLGSLSSTIASLKIFTGKGIVDWKLGRFLLLPTIIGALIGSYVVVIANQALYSKLLGLVIIITIPFLFLKHSIGMHSITPSNRRRVIGWVLALLAGVLGGVFASTGLWFTYLLLFLGQTYLESSATRKIISLAVAIVSLVVLIYFGLVNWVYATALLIGSFAGGVIGTHLTIKMGNIWIRRLFVLIAVILGIKLIF